VFQKRIQNLQKYVTNEKYYKGYNKSHEKSRFVEGFSLQSWEKLSHSEKSRHSLEDCKPCSFENELSMLHTSFGKDRQEAVSLCHEMTNILIKKSGQPKSIKGSRNVAKTIINAIKPVFEEKTGHNFTQIIAHSLNLTPKQKPEEKRKQATNKIRNSHEKTTTSQREGDADLNYFLASGKSYREHDRDRFATGFVSSEQCATEVQGRLQKENQKIVKPKPHHGPFQSYEIDDKAVSEALSTLPDDRPINWTRLAKETNVTVKGKTPGNAGQVLKQYAIYKGLHSNKMEYLRRIRRRKKRINSKLTIPTQRSAKAFKTIIKSHLAKKKLYIGDKIAPKPFKTNFLNKEGELEEKTTQIHGRKLPLPKIIQDEYHRLDKAGVIRHTDFQQMQNIH
jgi:hypothetical protein